VGNPVKAAATFIAALATAGLALPAWAAHPATACIKQTVAAAAKVGVETDAEDTSIVVFAPTEAPLRPLLAEMIACVARALPERRDVAGENGGPTQHFWRISATKEYCRSTNAIDTLGGTSDKKSYKSFFLICMGAPK